MASDTSRAGAEDPVPPVKYYRMYLIDPVGDFLDVAETFCPDDDAALDVARAQLVRVRAVEVRQRDRFVERFERTPARPAGRSVSRGAV